MLEQWKQNKIQFLHEEDLNQILSKILTDKNIHGIYNLAPDSYSRVNELVPNKKYIRVPLSLIIVLLWVLWYLRVLNLRPASLQQSIYPLVLSPLKLISRYMYKFKYSSEEAFLDTLKHYKLQKIDVPMEALPDHILYLKPSKTNGYHNQPVKRKLRTPTPSLLASSPNPENRN